MERYIKYKRFNKIVDDNELEEFFDSLIKEGWEIISYKEIIHNDFPIQKKQTNIISNIIDYTYKLEITVIAGKKQNTI